MAEAGETSHRFASGGTIRPAQPAQDDDRVPVMLDNGYVLPRRARPAMAEVPREPGWYRLTETGWVPVGDAVAEAEIAAGGGWDLMHVMTAAMAETPLLLWGWHRGGYYRRAA